MRPNSGGYGEINRIARAHGLFVMEDAAQSFGAEYHGQKACGLGDCACTSFFPAKPLGCYGDGGAEIQERGFPRQRSLCGSYLQPSHASVPEP